MLRDGSETMVRRQDDQIEATQASLHREEIVILGRVGEALLHALEPFPKQAPRAPGLWLSQTLH